MDEMEKNGKRGKNIIEHKIGGIPLANSNMLQWPLLSIYTKQMKAGLVH